MGESARYPAGGLHTFAVRVLERAGARPEAARLRAGGVVAAERGGGRV